MGGERAGLHTFDIINKKGVDFYIGHLIKNSNQLMEKRTGTKLGIVKEESLDEIIMKNPGSMTYEQLQKYIASKKNNNS